MRGGDLLEQLQPLARHRRLGQDESGDAAPRSRQARDEAAADRIGNDCENDWDGARLLQQSRRVGRAIRKDQFGLERDEVLRELLPRLRVAGWCPAILDPDVAALRPSELLESLPERRDAGLCFRVALGIRHQHANPPGAILRAHTQRRRESRAA